MSKRLFWAAAGTLALAACGGEDTLSQGEQPAPSAPARGTLTPRPWSKIAPGVWERVREDGLREQAGFGIEALEFGLQEERGARALIMEAQKVGGKTAGLDTRLRETDKEIRFLEESIAKARQEGVLEQTPEEFPGVFASGSVQSMAGEEGIRSDYWCAGGYEFDIQFYYDMAGGNVTAQGHWSEFGPYAPIQKEFFLSVKAWLDNPYGELADGDGGHSLFKETCCFSTPLYAARAFPTFTPLLEGGGYISGARGCGARRYKIWNY
jgi:hypothetical protein